MNSAIDRDALNEEFGMFPMKTAIKTVFGLMTVGFVLGTLSHQILAQDKPAAPEKPMSPQAMEILCKRFPLNSRCQGGAATPASTDSAGASSTTPSGSTTPEKPADPMAPAAGAPEKPADPMAPAAGAPPASGTTDSAPTGAGSTTPSGPSSEPSSTTPSGSTTPSDAPKGDMPKP